MVAAREADNESAAAGMPPEDDGSSMVLSSQLGNQIGDIVF